MKNRIDQVVTSMVRRAVCGLSLPALIAGAFLTISPTTAEAKTVCKPNDWRIGQIWTKERDVFVWSINWETNEPHSYCHNLISRNNWGGQWNWKGGRGGYAAQLTHGTAINGDKTVGTLFPTRISDAKKINTYFRVKRGAIAGDWKQYWEMFTYTSSTGGFGKSIFVQPDYAESTVKRPGDFNFVHKGVTWYGHVWPNVVTFRRSSKITGIKAEWIDLKAFAQEAARRDPAISSSHWLRGVSAGFESFHGFGSFKCESFTVKN